MGIYIYRERERPQQLVSLPPSISLHTLNNPGTPETTLNSLCQGAGFIIEQAAIIREGTLEGETISEELLSWSVMNTSKAPTWMSQEVRVNG